MGPNYLHQFQNVNSEFQQQVAVEKTLGGLLYLVQAANQKPSQAGDCYIFFYAQIFFNYTNIYIYMGTIVALSAKTEKTLDIYKRKKHIFLLAAFVFFEIVENTYPST